MALEEPQVGHDVELGHHLALAIFAAIGTNVGDAVEHQHRRQRQLGVTGTEQFAPAASQEILIGEM